MLTLPLTSEYLNKIRKSIKEIAETFQVLTIPKDQIGCIPGGRRLVEAQQWPLEGALDLFYKEGAISRPPTAIEMQRGQNSFNILNEDYFNIQFENLEIPVKFDIDKRINQDLKIMTGLYADIYDIENRLRFALDVVLVNKFGHDYVSNLPNKVRSSIEHEKTLSQWYIKDNRGIHLQYAQFGDLLKILQMNDLLDGIAKRGLVEQLPYLGEIRTRVAHNNIIPSSEVEKTKDKCNECRAFINGLVL